jgi:hypothetical protein
VGQSAQRHPGVAKLSASRRFGKPAVVRVRQASQKGDAIPASSAKRKVILVRVMLGLWAFILVGGLAYFIVIGLTHH